MGSYVSSQTVRKVLHITDRLIGSVLFLGPSLYLSLKARWLVALRTVSSGRGILANCASRTWGELFVAYDMYMVNCMC